MKSLAFRAAFFSPRGVGVVNDALALKGTSLKAHFTSFASIGNTTKGALIDRGVPEDDCCSADTPTPDGVAAAIVHILVRPCVI